MLKTHDFYYDLPEELIAQTPLERRDGSRLMVLNKDTGKSSTGIFMICRSIYSRETRWY